MDALPDFDAAAEALFAMYSRNEAVFRAAMPPAWQAGFVTWLAYRRPPAVVDRLRKIARDAASAQTNALLDGVALLPR